MNINPKGVFYIPFYLQDNLPSFEKLWKKHPEFQYWEMYYWLARKISDKHNKIDPCFLEIEDWESFIQELLY